MEKTKAKSLFTTVMVLRKTVDKLKDINNQEVNDNQETITLYKTLDKLICEKHKKLIK